MVVALSLLSILFGGCSTGVDFPASSLSEAARSAGALAAYDADKDGRADFFLFADEHGRVNRIGYSRPDGSEADDIINLDTIPFSRCRHLVLILDGFCYDVVERFYEQGRLRVCHRPSRIIAPYPTLTDLTLEDELGYIPCRAFEALYYDRKVNKMVGGSWDYLRGVNEPYNQLLQYRANTIWDAIGYVEPWPVFKKETSDSLRLFRKRQTQEVLAYYVSSAGVGTSQGAAGQLRCLERIEQLVNQVLWETRGLVKITIMSDHGHSYTNAKRIDLENYLAGKGWRLVDSLRRDRDVAYVRFGLVTYAGFSTNQPAELAADLIAADGVDIASYIQRDAVVVLGSGRGQAVVEERSGRFRYRMIDGGDPLKLKEVLATLAADAEGYYDARELLAATVKHEYPNPLQRLWRAHYTLAENKPDVIVSLQDGYYSGARGFASWVKLASTHGSLNNKNSTAFIMSSAGPLPQYMRALDVPANMKAMTGADFPMRK